MADFNPVGRVAAAVGFFLLISVGLFALSAGPTVPRTGAPGEVSSCVYSGCHHTNENTRGTMALSFSGGNTYTQGVWKRVTITITPNPAVGNIDGVQYGFQATARQSSGSRVGRLEIVNTESNFQTVKCAATTLAMLTSRPSGGSCSGGALEYVQHTQPYTGGPSPSYSVSFLWKPSTVTCFTFPCSQDLGTLTFYATSVLGLCSYPCAILTDAFRTSATLTYEAPGTSADPVYPTGSLGLEALDTPSNRIIATRIVTANPLSKTAMKRDGSRLYALTKSGEQLLAIDPQTGALLGTFSLSALSKLGSDIALSPNESSLYIVGPSTDSTTSHLDIFDVGGPSVFGLNPSFLDLNSANYLNLAVRLDGKRIYIAKPYNSGPILVIDTANFSQLAPITTASPLRGLAVSPDSSRLYVTSQDNTLTIFSTATNAVLYHYALTPKPTQIVFSPDGSRAYVVCDGTPDVITTIDTSTSMPLGTYTVSNFPGFGWFLRVSPDGTYLYGGGSPSLYGGGSVPAWSVHLVAGLPNGLPVAIPSAQGVTDIGVRPPPLLAQLKKLGGQITSQ